MNVDLTPYQGRWVALIQGQVAGVGETGHAAALLAHRNRPKEKLTVHYVEPPGGTPLPLSPLLTQLQPYLAQLETPIYLVGGAVRDALMGRLSDDLDFVVPEKGIATAFTLGNALHHPAYALDKERDTGRVVLPDTKLDVACFRGPDLTADLLARDFTINAIALPAAATHTSSLIDPCNGQADIQARLIRQASPTAISSDPVRGLRAIRQAEQFGFTIEPETEQAIRAAAPHLTRISAERSRDEFLKLLLTPAPHTALQQMITLGLMAVLLPEIPPLDGVAQSPPHHEPVLEHTLSVLRWLVTVEGWLRGEIPDNKGLLAAQKALAPYRADFVTHLSRPVDGGLDGWTLLRLGALFHDVGKGQTQTQDETGRFRFLGHEAAGAKLTGQILNRLVLSRQAVQEVQGMVAHHMRPLFLVQEEKLTARAVYRYFKATGVVGLDVLLLALADHLATYNGVGDAAAWRKLCALIRWLLHHYFQQPQQTIAPPPLLDGHALMQALGLPPGPQVGKLLRLIEEAQATGEVKTAEQALALAQKQVKA